MDLESLYQEIILDHYKHPRGPTCGDEITLRVEVDGGTITDVSYDGMGCSISQASASVLFEQLVGQSLQTGLATTDEFQALMQGRGQVEPDEDVLGDAVAFAGVAKYPARVKCALLAWMAWKDAVAQAVESTPEVSS